MEYIAGTDPASQASAFTVHITPGSGQEVVWIPTITPTPQYGNCGRYYTLETTTNLMTGPWTSIVSRVDVPATIGPVVAYTNLTVLRHQFYRGRVRLTGN